MSVMMKVPQSCGTFYNRVYNKQPPPPPPPPGAEGSGKLMMKLSGVDVGPPRLPALPLPPEASKTLEQDLRDIGFFEWA